MLAAISEFERDLLKEGSKSGMAHARARGTKSGRAIDRAERVKRLLAEGEVFEQSSPSWESAKQQ
jgi:DNA invertase Pin-like site-specific DNA recombinase